jgi:hypothetical protein
MGHHHEEDHHSIGRNDHAHAAKELTFEEKGGKLLRHWIQHNNDHVGNYNQWAAEFRLHGYPEVAVLLESVVGLTTQINEALDDALQHIPHPPK